MAKVKNETRLIVSLLKERAKAEKLQATNTAAEIGKGALAENVRYCQGIQWVEDTLMEIICELERE